MYVTMFPQLIAGPIVRYSDIHTEIENREHNISKIASGIELFIIGLAKKVLLANLCGVYYNDVWITNPDINLSIISGWFGMLFYTFQIYFDFSGYTDMAIGLSRVFGFSTYPKNFNYPYIAKSITFLEIMYISHWEVIG
jgi:alginate O-acetyltransferase complex protein AlgI